MSEAKQQPPATREEGAGSALTPAEREGDTGSAFAPLVRVATWVMRLAFLAVFVVNVQCALAFVINPAAYAPAYELAGVAGEAAVRGLGIAFLMWNVTYPAFIVAPAKTRVLGWVILAQQVVGLVGESLLLAGLPADHAVLVASIKLFITFDAAGLVAMALTFGVWLWVNRHHGS